MEYKILDMNLFHYEEDTGKRYKSKKKMVVLDDFVHDLSMDLACHKCKKWLERKSSVCIFEIKNCPKFKREKKIVEGFLQDVFYGEGLGTPILKKEPKEEETTHSKEKKINAKKPHHLFLTYHWFDEIKSGRKTVEFREVKMVHKRPQHYCVGDKIIFHKGYSSTTISKTIKELTLISYSSLPAEEKKFFKGKETSTFLAIEFI